MKLAALLPLLLLAATAGAQSPAADKGPADKGTAKPQDAKPQEKPQPLPGEPRCGFCSTTGRVPFARAAEFEPEERVGPSWKARFCSEAFESENMGLSWMPCPSCKTPSLKAIAQAEYDEHKAASAEWFKERRRVDKVVGAEKPLVHVQTTHFIVVWNYPKITTAAKKNYDSHAAAHLYAERLEEFYARFQTMFGITDANNMKNIHTLMLFGNHDEAWRAGPAYTMLQGVPTVKRAGGANHDSTVVTWWDKAIYPKEADMWRHQLHNFTHQFTAIYYDIAWFQPGQFGLSPPWLNDKYGWLDEGLAHWFEIDFDKKSQTYCMRETDTDSRWGGDDWRKNIYKAVAAGDIPSFADISTKPSEALTSKENQFAWTWVDYLMQKDTLAMGKALKGCKLEHASRDLLKESWNITVLDFQEKWTAWVLENYAPSKKR